MQFHELPDVAETPQSSSGQSINLPFTPKQGMSALETLAEVSRQHLDLSGNRAPEKGQSKSPPASAAIHNGGLDEFIVQDDRPDGTDLSVVGDRAGEFSLS
jgi:hypothetical protein